MKNYQLISTNPNPRAFCSLRGFGLAAALLAVSFSGGLMAAEGAKGEFPDSYYYYEEDRPENLRAMEGKPAPSLTVKDWIGAVQEVAKLKGKVVVVDFWATWCPPCREALPENVKMIKEHGKAGLVIIGVHDAKRGADKMAAMAKKEKINYPLSVDDAGKSAKIWNVQFWPSYFVIDRKGIIRAAGIAPEHVEEAVKKVLADKK
jgi:thiol-disulfide isomerase/thioredoxin